MPLSIMNVYTAIRLYCNSYENSKIIYSEIARVIKPGGKLYVRTFAYGSWGCETGESVGVNAWLCNEGPLKDKGLARFTKESDLKDLLPMFHIDSLEKLMWTSNYQANLISEWIVHASKRIKNE